ncbi:MAG: hypothetical protein IKT00_07270 [Prevotella sp.]|nr:hypothetical protein [Prevotella sp.]
MNKPIYYMSPSSRKLKFVQFTHPGGEHSVSPAALAAGVKSWSRVHGRKFIKSKGLIVTGSTLSIPQDLLFWGEWEPDSYVKRVTAFSGSGILPKYVHEPFITLMGGKMVVPSMAVNQDKCCLNTDPFVFNDYFLYSLCKQVRFVNLRYLDQGSIIIFGSTISKEKGGPYFVVDTVFVVDKWRSYHPGSARADLKGFIPKYYDDIMLFDYTGSIATEELTCYHGAAFDRSVGGMFSFVPCKPCDKGHVVGFSRPVISSIDFPGIINDNLNSAPKYSDISSLAEMKKIWDKLCGVIQSQGFELGVNLKYKKIP